MTVTAHSKRIFHGYREEPTPPPQGTRFNLRVLNPWLYADIPSSKIIKPEPEAMRAPKQPLAQLIRQWLTKNGPATYRQIAEGLGVTSLESVNRRLKDGIDGVAETGIYLPEKGRPGKLWGVVEDDHSAKD